jgi:hypothetical protein
MHSIEPFFNWRQYYTAETDKRSPFYKRVYSEFYFTNSIYDYLIHPQWDDMGSSTLYLKILFTDYDKKYAILEFIGEWNDCISNDVMFLKRDVIDAMIGYGINKFVLIGENILNFHHDGDDYYEEWFQDVEDGWIAAVNFQPHVLKEFHDHNIDYYLNFGGELDNLSWRTHQPDELFNRVEGILRKRLVSG